MKSVRAKFKVDSITNYNGGGMKVSASPVYGDTPENKTFSDNTPTGSLDLNISPGKEAQGLFEAGKEYFVDISVAE